MVEHRGKPVAEQVQRDIDEELVPLSIAATVTYFHLAEARSLVEDAPSLSRAIVLTAIALSQVVQIRVRAAEAPRSMSAREVREQLFAPAQRGEPPDLDEFLIRRGDLRAAIDTLTKTRQWLR